MKIIDLLNQIANGEEVPKKIKLDTIIFLLKDGEYFAGEYGSSLIEFINFYQKDLNKEVEIIKEEPRNIEVCGSLFTKSEYEQLARKKDKKIEKLETYKEFDDNEHYANILKVSKNGEYEINEDMSVVIDKINELIDKINKKER